MRWPTGVQSFTYRNFSMAEIRRELDDTSVQHVELCGVHVDPAASTEEVTAIRSEFEAVNVDICGYGVHDFDSPEEVDDVLGLAAELGAAYVTVNFPADRDDIADALVAAGEQYGLRVAIHNHGPDAEYSTVEDVQEVLEGRSPRLGACVDTGHFLRSGETPADVIPVLGDRVHAVHFKDFVGGDSEVIPGDGDLNIADTLSLLAEHTAFEQPIVIEYEEDADDPTPAVRTIVDRLADV